MSINGVAVIATATPFDAGSRPANAAMPVPHTPVKTSAATVTSECVQVTLGWVRLETMLITATSCSMTARCRLPPKNARIDCPTIDVLAESRHERFVVCMAADQPESSPKGWRLSRTRIAMNQRVVAKRLGDYPTDGWMAFCIGVIKTYQRISHQARLFASPVSTACIGQVSDEPMA
jgi:hypothetical protein